MATRVKTELLEQTLESGIEPFTTLIAPVRSAVTGETYAFRTMRRVNSMNLGVLAPAEYRNVCDRTQQSIKLAASDFADVVGLYRELQEHEIDCSWISFHFPVKLALKPECDAIVREMLSAAGISKAEHICAELGTEALYEDSAKISTVLKDLKHLGFTTSITSFGDEFCPIGRLQGLPVDVCIFDIGVGARLVNKEGVRAVYALTDFVRHNHGSSVLALKNGEKATRDEADTYDAAGFAGYTVFEDETQSWLTRDDFFASATDTTGGDA